MRMSVLINAFIAAGAIGAFRIVKHGTADGAALQAAAATDALIGVTTDVATVSGETVDVIRNGLAEVEYGGTVTRGAPVTSDASGRAVAAAPAVGSNVRIIGYAEVSGVSGDIGSIHISPGSMQG